MWNIKILLTLIGFILFNQPIFSQYSSGKNSYKPDLILDNRTNVNQLRESNAKDILRHSSDFNQSFQKKERLNLSNRNLGVSVPYVAQPINNDQLSENSISFDNPGITHRDFLDMGRRPQIAQANDGTLWTVFIYDMGGAYSEADGRNDMVVYSSVDDGVTWNYSFYIYNASANIDLPDVEALDDRLLFLHSTYYDDGTSTMGIFWLLNDFSNYNTTFLEMPEGFDTFEWGSILADKFYYDIESTWVYITYMVWDSSTGNAGVYYTRSIDFGLTLENLTQMFTESMYTEDVAGSIVYYRPGIATAYSYGFEEFVWTSLSMNGDVYASKIDVYTNEVTNQVVMAADEFNENRAPSISAYYENIVIFSSMSWLSGDYNNDLGMTFSYDEGQTWGDESAYYYWPDPSDFSESGATPNFAPDGVMGFAYISESSFDESDYVFFRSNSTGNFLNGWDESVQVGGVYTDVGIIGSVIQNSVFSMVFDDDPNSIIYFESFPLDEIQYGNVSGYITNATNGNPVSGAFIQIGGQETFTDNSGYYFISEVSPAAIEANFFAQPTEGDVPLDVQFYNLTSEGGTSITATADGYATYFDNTLELIVGETISYNVSLSPLDENYMRFVLNWDDEPADLDIHLITESSHIYYGNTGDANSYPYATLDQDVTQGYGPETITISQSSPETYKLYVYNYTQDPSITTSNAVLQAYSYGEPVFTVNIPETGSGEYWHVADVNGQTNSFSLVNEIQNSAPEFEGSSDGDHLVGIDIMTDNYPGETSWELTDYYSGAVVASGGPLSDANSLYNWEIYVETSAYYFTIFDSFGDGICCTYGSGYYTVYSDGYEIATSQFSGASESVFINFTRSNGGNYAISRTEYLEPIPFAKGTNLAKNDNVWPTSDLFLIREGTFGIQEDQIPLKQSNYTRDITFTWDFGDGNTSNDATPLHTYSSAGNYTVSLTASDGVNNSLYERVDYIVVNQGQTNQAPVVANPIGDISLVENESEEVNLNFVFSDPDGDALSYSVDVTSDDGTPVVASVSGTSLTITGIGGGQATVTVTASDAGGLSVTDELLVTVTEGNSAPFVLNEIPDLEVILGEVLNLLLNESQIFIDPDGDDLTYTAFSSNSEIVSVGINGEVLEIEGVSPGAAEIYVSAMDPSGASSNDQFQVVVMNPGVSTSPPVLADFPLITLNEDESSATLILDDYVTDEDTEVEDLFWFASVSGSDGILVSINPVSHHLVVSGINDWNGATNFSLIVSDGQNLAMGVIQVEVNPVNDPPFISPMTSIAFMEDMSYEFPAHDFFHDPDTELSDLTIEIQGSQMVITEVSNDNSIITFSAVGDWNGQESLDIVLSDSEFSDAVSFMVAVVPVNDPPIFNNLTYPGDGEEIDNGEITFTWEPASDVDINDLLSYHISVYSNQQMTDVSAEASGEEMLEAVINLNSGTYYWSVDVIDSEGETSSSEIRSFTLDVNSAPVLTDIDPQSMEEDASYELVLSATDENEGDVLTYTATSSSSDAMVSVSNDTLSVELTENWFGVAEIEVSVSDGELSDIGLFELTVNSVNDAPEVFGLSSPSDSTVISITQQEISENMTLMVSWDESSDIDGDALTYGFALYNGVYGPDAPVLIDTTLSENMIQIPYQAIAQLIGSLGEMAISGDWTVYATDGVDTTMSDDVYHITLDASGVLSIDGQMLPEKFVLHQNYPNPFNPTTQIKYDLPKDVLVNINIYDLMGRSIKSLLSDNQPAGYRSILWDATNNYGEAVPAGMYIYVIQAGDFRATKKMVLLK